jgi:hypothetical protein
MLVAKNDNPGTNRSTGGFTWQGVEIYHSLANIRRVLRDRQRDGFRPDGAIENPGMIREPGGERLVSADNPDEKRLKRKDRRLITRKVDLSFERFSEGLEAGLGHPLVEGRGQCGHGRSLGKSTAKDAG